MRNHGLLATTFLASAAAVILASITVTAQPPECKSGPGRKGYDVGYASQSRFLRHLFGSQYSCGTLEDFVDTVQTIFVPEPTSPDIYLKCQNEGRRDAISPTVEEITRQCIGGTQPGPGTLDASDLPAVAQSGECDESGRETGRYGAELYCAPPCPTCAPAPTLSLCDVVAMNACKRAFYNTVMSTCRTKAAADPSGFREARDSACQIEPGGPEL